MIALLIVLSWLVVGAVVMRIVAGHVAWRIAESYEQTKPDIGDWTGAILLGAFVGLFAPLAVIWLAVGNRWAIGAEAEAIQRKQQERIKELERALQES